jgi:hypothetical protein
MEETRWEAVSPDSKWSIPLFHLKNRRTFTLFTTIRAASGFSVVNSMNVRRFWQRFLMGQEDRLGVFTLYQSLPYLAR